MTSSLLESDGNYPLPDFYKPEKVPSVYRVDYAALADQAPAYRQSNKVQPSSADRQKTWLLLVDVQNTFCIPGYELYVGGRSGSAAVDDNRRLAEFIYRNLGRITHISATMDTHFGQQIFHPVFFVDAAGKHPAPYTDIQAADIQAKKWNFNPALASQFDISPEYGQEMVLHYARSLEAKGKYALTIWPYHAMLGGVGHALVPAIEEAVFFHSLVRYDQPEFEIKGDKPFTENYSVVGPEVLNGPMDEPLGARNPKFIEQLQQFDRLYVAGQAKSHCVAWTVADLLEDIRAVDPSLAKRVYLLEDCCSPVVIPGIIDHTEAAQAAFARFAEAGMRVVKSTDPAAL